MDYGAQDVVCPYFADKEEARRIVCEGPVRGSRTIISFKRGEYKSRHRKFFCTSIEHYRMCPVARMCEAKYK